MFRLLTCEKKSDRGVNASDLWLYARYQLLSRALIIIVLSPLYTMLINDLDPFRAMIASAGLEAAIAQGAQWSEINVQRTKDSHYIIHHDATFKRLAGEPRTAQEMTLADIRQLQIANIFTPASPSGPVATVEEMLDAAKERIGLFIELKGLSADQAMVDDLAETIRQRGMNESIALISLNLDPVRYSKQAPYPRSRSAPIAYTPVAGGGEVNGPA